MGTTTPSETATQRRRRLVDVAEAVAGDQDGVVSRKQLRALGLTKAHVRTETRAKRWRTHGNQTVAVHAAPLDQRARWRSALFEVGCDAALDGVTSLIAGGMKGFDEADIHVSTSHGAHPDAPPGVRLHETRRRRPEDLVGAGILRTRPAVAAVRGALWARSDRQAALIVVMAVQQRLTTGAAIRRELLRVRRDKRRSFISTILLDVSDGAQALGELDFAALCRKHGLPTPDRQTVRAGRSGRVYLDVFWDRWGVVVEIEGIHHGSGESQVADALRQNSLSIRRNVMLRIPLLGLRILPDEFMAQVGEALSAAGRHDP